MLFFKCKYCHPTTLFPPPPPPPTPAPVPPPLALRPLPIVP